MKADLIHFVEAAYLIEQSPDAWLQGISSAARPIVDAGIGVVSYAYDASDPAHFRLDTIVHEGLPDQAVGQFVRSLSALDADYVRSSYGTLSCGTASEVPGFRDVPLLEELGRRFGFRDALTINGANPDLSGCAITAFLPKQTTLSKRRRSVLAKLSCHLAAADRLRRALASAEARSSAAEAILDHEGNVHHADGNAQSKAAIASLTQSALAIANARGRLRILEPERAVDEWKGLIAARWTLLDVCEQDGRKYLVARENRPRVRAVNGLTDREQEVVTFAAMGQHNKLIAYNLGISDSTVRVLMSRAAHKLGARSRDELIRHARLP